MDKNKIQKVPGAEKVDIAPPGVPEKAAPGEKLPGYVINSVTIPSGAKSNFADRYFKPTDAGDAWKDGRADLAKFRMAVVIGVNTYLPLDVNDAGTRAGNLSNAVNGIDTRRAPYSRLMVSRGNRRGRRTAST